MPALNAAVTAYINRVITLIDNTTQAADIDVEVVLKEEVAIGDTTVYVSGDQVSRLIPGGCTLFDVVAGTSQARVITYIDPTSGRIRLAAGPAAAYSRGDRLFQTYTDTGRRPVQKQPDTIPVKEIANILQLLTDATDQTVLTATGGTTTTVVNANTLVNVDTGLTALIGSTVTMVTFALGTPGETSKVVACPDVNTLTVFPPFSAAVGAGDTYTVEMDQVDDQITELLNCVPIGSVSPDAAAKNAAQYWLTCASAIARFNDQLASGMATVTVFTVAEMDYLRGLMRTRPTTRLSVACTAADTVIFVDDIASFASEGGTAVVSPGGAGGGTEETIVYTRPRNLGSEGGGVPCQTGPISIGMRESGGKGQVTVALGMVNNQPVGTPIEHRTKTIGGAATTVPVYHPAPPHADNLKEQLGTLIDKIRDTVTAYVIPT